MHLSLPLLWFLLILKLSENKVNGCLDMLIKEFTQMFAGPGGSMMGLSNSNNLDRIRMFNNYQPPSIDQIEDEQDMEGKIEDYDSDEDVDDYDTYDDFGNKKTAGNERESTRGMNIYKQLKERNVQDKMKKIPSKRDNLKNFRGKDVNQRSGKNLGRNAVRESRNEETKQRNKPLRKDIRQRKPMPKASKLYKSEPKASVYNSKPIQNGLYDLEPKTNEYDSKMYRKNVFVDDDSDMNTFQTRDKGSNVPRTVKGKQPFIDMMVNILDTMQLTSKHDYKRAKEKELRDKARYELQKMHRS